MNELRFSNTYDEASFAREFMSKWTSTVEGSLFDYDKLVTLRKIKRAEWKPVMEDQVFYVASVDVARSKARSIMEVFKVRIGKDHFTKSLVNIFPMEGRNFLYQSMKIKEWDMIFGFDWITIDTNGMGVGLVDFLMNENVNPNSREMYPPYNVINIKEYPDYAIDQKIGAPAKIHILKTNQVNAGKIHTNCYNELFAGRVKLLVDEKEAKDSLLQLQKGQRMSFEERIAHMEPYKWTSMLISETSNLKINRNNVNLKLEMIRTDREKDTFSALEYGLWTICEREREYYAKLRKPSFSASDMMFFN